jgi:hypothetical protein
MSYPAKNQPAKIVHSSPFGPGAPLYGLKNPFKYDGRLTIDPLPIDRQKAFCTHCNSFKSEHSNYEKGHSHTFLFQ